MKCSHLLHWLEGNWALLVLGTFADDRPLPALGTLAIVDSPTDTSSPFDSLGNSVLCFLISPRKIDHRKRDPCSISSLFSSSRRSLSCLSCTRSASFKTFPFWLPLKLFCYSLRCYLYKNWWRTQGAWPEFLLILLSSFRNQSTQRSLIPFSRYQPHFRLSFQCWGQR